MCVLALMGFHILYLAIIIFENLVCKLFSIFYYSFLFCDENL